MKSGRSNLTSPGKRDSFNDVSLVFILVFKLKINRRYGTFFKRRETEGCQTEDKKAGHFLQLRVFFPQRYQLRMISTIQRGFRCWVARWGQQFSPWDWYNGGYGFSDHHLGEDMDVSKNRGTPKSSHFNRVFHYKPSILGYPYVWKHPYNSNKIASSEYQMYHLRTKTYKNNNF